MAREIDTFLQLREDDQTRKVIVVLGPGSAETDFPGRLNDIDVSGERPRWNWAEIHLAAGRIGQIPGAQTFLNVDGAANRFDRTGEFGEHCVARGVEYPSAGAGDKIVHDAAIGCEPPQRLFFILGNKPAVTSNVSGKNGRDFSFHRKSAAMPQAGTYNARQPRCLATG